MRIPSWAGLAARLAVGIVLVIAAAPKATAPPEQFAFVISAYDILSPGLALPMAALLPWVELFLGWALILGVGTRTVTTAAGALFGLFLIALGSTIAKGIQLPSCGCFGGDIHLTPAQAFLLDSAMISLCWLARRAGSCALSLDAWAELGL